MRSFLMTLMLLASVVGVIYLLLPEINRYLKIRAM